MNHMSNRTDVLRGSLLLVSILLTLVVFSVSGAEARDKFLNKFGEFVWHGYDGSDYEIFRYANGTITQITDNEYDDYDPQVNNKGKIIWYGYDGNDYEIFLYKHARKPQAFKPGDEWHPFEAKPGGAWRSGANSDMIWSWPNIRLDPIRNTVCSTT